VNVHVDTSEVDDLVADLVAAGPKAHAASSVLLTGTAEELRNRARDAAPFRTGELRRSIYVRGSGDSRTVGTDVRQGFFQEFGTSVMPPQPWLFANADRASDRLVVGLGKLGDPL
jgi:hypothetical protein